MHLIYMLHELLMQREGQIMHRNAAPQLGQEMLHEDDQMCFNIQNCLLQRCTLQCFYGGWHSLRQNP